MRRRTIRRIRIAGIVVLVLVVLLVIAGNYMLYTALRPADNLDFSREKAFG